MQLKLPLFLHRRFFLIKKKMKYFLPFYIEVYFNSENFYDSALWFVVKLVINTYKSQEERVRSLEANDEEWNRKSIVTFAIFKVSKVSNFRNRIIEIDFLLKIALSALPSLTFLSLTVFLNIFIIPVSTITNLFSIATFLE